MAKEITAIASTEYVDEKIKFKFKPTGTTVEVGGIPEKYKGEGFQNGITDLQEVLNKILYPELKCTITFHPNGGNQLPPAQVVDKFSNVNGFPQPGSRDGHTFKGWYSDPLFGEESKIESISDIRRDYELWAKWEILQYKVTFISGGETVSEQWIDWGKSADEPNHPEKEGYSPDGWDKAFTNVTSDLTVTAKYVIKKYNVTFKLMGGNISGNTNDVGRNGIEHGSSAAAPSDPVKTGYAFGGWSPNQFASGVSTHDEVAQWVANRYYIQPQPNDGLGSMQALSVAYDESVALPACKFTRSGHQFTGWMVDGVLKQPGETVTKLISVNNGTFDIIAQWQAVSADLDFYYGVVDLGFIPELKDSQQEYFDELYWVTPDNSADLKKGSINKSSPKNVTFSGDGIAVLLLPADFGEPSRINDGMGSNVKGSMTKTSVMFNGISYFMYDVGGTNKPVGYTLTIVY